MRPFGTKIVKRTAYALIMLGAAGAAGCIFQSPRIRQVDPRTVKISETPSKAHLVDGSTVVYPTGVFLVENRLMPRGTGRRYAAGDTTFIVAGPVAIDSVVGMEAFDARTNVGASVLGTIGGIALGTVGTVALAIALFGSCPTFYADSAGTELLQGEGFSYSIAPLFEQRDLDRLRLIDAKDGRIVLRVRNEALETHYINHVELLEIERQADELALGDNNGQPLALRNLSSPFKVRDRAGRDVAKIVSALDQDVYSTHDGIVRDVKASDLEDYLELTLPAARGVDSVAMVLDMRNSLLNTVLLYDHILGAQGIKSLDFLGKDLKTIRGAVDLGRWYATNMGMRVSVWDGSAFRQVARLGDSGPIAFHKVAVMIPAAGNGDSVRVRLSFVADNWRIDGIAFSADWRRPKFRYVSPSRVVMPEPAQNPAAMAAIADPDERYLMTSPGQALAVEFEVGRSASPRSWLLASQGYYTEWVRGSWIKSASGKQFEPTNESLVEAIKGWRMKQREMERSFYDSRIAAGQP